MIWNTNWWDETDLERDFKLYRTSDTRRSEFPLRLIFIDYPKTIQKRDADGEWNAPVFFQKKKKALLILTSTGAIIWNDNILERGNV